METDANPRYKIPVEADFLFAYSTVPGIGGEGGKRVKFDIQMSYSKIKTKLIECV